MKLIIETARFVGLEGDLNTLGEFVDNEYMVWVEETNTVYSFFEGITLEGVVNEYGTWVESNYVRLLQLTFGDVPTDYTEISYVDLKDYNFLTSKHLTSDEASRLQAVLGFLPKEIVLSPSVAEEPIQVPTEGEYVVSLAGYNFSSLVICTLSEGTLLGVEVPSSTEILINLTGLTYGRSSVLKLIYPGGYYREIPLECIQLPSGETLPVLKNSYVAGKNYYGQPFSRTAYSRSWLAAKAFDDNVGTRHYASYSTSNGHYLGVMLNNPSYLISVEYQGEYGSSAFLLQGSNNTTDGEDGDWEDLGEYDFSSKQTLSYKAFVYNAYRIVWVRPVNTAWANARELIFNIKQ